MKKVAIVGGGIAGLSAAYEVACQQANGAQVDCALFEATDRLGGIVETHRRDGFVLECGPDSWVTEKSAARELAIELGLGSQVIQSNDHQRTTYLAGKDGLRPLPRGMRMMVPVDLDSILESETFSPSAKAAYRLEIQRADELKNSALDRTGPFRDESVREFVARHFGEEVVETLAAPLLAGVFGGFISELSARAVLPAYVALERDHGSLILGLQRREQTEIPLPIFSTLQTGLDTLIGAMAAKLSAEDIRLDTRVHAVKRTANSCLVHSEGPGSLEATDSFDALILATPAKATAQLIVPICESMAELLPQKSSSAIVVNLGFDAIAAAAMHIPTGFGFLVPHTLHANSTAAQDRGTPLDCARDALLACTFVDQKFDFRAPSGGRLLRAFFGGPHVQRLMEESDDQIAKLAHEALESFLGKLPTPSVSLVRALPDSLPLYAPGHLEGMAALETKLAAFPNLRLVGNAYRGVGLPDLIGAGRKAAVEIVSNLQSGS